MLRLILTEQDETTNLAPQSLDEIARLGAKTLLTKALREEVNQYLLGKEEERDSQGHRLVVRNGLGKERTILTGTGEIKVQAPRINDRREGEKFTSNILPSYLRKLPNVESVLPVLYLKGLSANSFSEALKSLLGERAKGLSKSTIHALKCSWERDLAEWRGQAVTDRFIYFWADGVNVNVRLGGDKKICLLVVIGVTDKGEKKLLAVQSGYRESKESWKSLFLNLQERGLQSPLCIIGDGGLGLWAATSELELFEKTKEQRCWVHKMGNVLDKLPKRVQPRAKSLLREMMSAKDEATAVQAKKTFEAEFSSKYPKATSCLGKDWDKLITHFGFPAEHWQHLRTTNPIESTFATVKLRTKVTKGAGSLKMAEVMAFKLMMEAEKKWRKIKGAEHIKPLLSGALYKDGELMQTAENGQQAIA